LLNRDGGRVPLCNRSDDVDSCEADLTINLRVCADGGGPVRDHLLYQRVGVLKTRHAEPRTQVMINAHTIGNTLTRHMRVPRSPNKGLVEMTVRVDEAGKCEHSVSGLEAVAGFGTHVAVDSSDSPVVDQNID